ncbi:hypothetical protein [Halpernia sp.]|uniref:hypothetical protein n=1 Tax=Halpernia sp. TaxID=2782209 RepID=UPI003A914050
MKYLFKIFILIFSVGVLLYPAQNSFAQNSAPDKCCTTQDVCHKNLPEKKHNKSGSHDCCNISISAFQFVKQSETIPTEVSLKNNFKNKVSFYFSNSLLPNALLSGIWQPPKFI